jgi:release factor glutamine methyltransferase
MTINEATLRLQAELQNIYDSREAYNITAIVLEHLTGLKKGERLIQRNSQLTFDQLTRFEAYVADLSGNMPVQYVLGEAWFYGYRFIVNDSVLIPRPETEELVKWILNERKDQPETSLLDVGTGSGCIAIALQLKMNAALVTACDISMSALEVASDAEALGAGVKFFQSDLLAAIAGEPSEVGRKPNRLLFAPQDVIVSNPPYIPMREGGSMSANVLHFEPLNALFVPDNDPLLFYRALAELAIRCLNPEGSVYVEIHENLADGVMSCFRERGFSELILRQDMQGKNRMVRARRQSTAPE